MIEQAVVDTASQCLVKGSKTEALALAREVIDGGNDPMELMTQAFIPAINNIGDMFARGQIFLPELIVAADAMGAVTDLVNEVISANSTQAQSRGTVLMATVKGDMHDIGKCIVTSLLQANNYVVHDIGRDVDIAKIIENAVKYDVDIIGTSTLLTTTMPRQKELEDTLRAQGLRARFKTIVGGAPVTPRWATRIGADAYAEDALDGVRKANELMGA